ncbi:MAG: hypothetical protein ABI229_07005 [Gemmatimonadaceae bacterium]
MTARNIWRGLLFSASLSALPGLGCRTWTPESATRVELVAKGEQGPVRVVKTDGSSVVLVVPVVADDSLIGATQTEPPQHVAIAVADIQRIEKPKPSFAKTMEGIQTTTRVVMGIVLALPTLFILSGGRLP